REPKFFRSRRRKRHTTERLSGSRDDSLFVASALPGSRRSSLDVRLPRRKTDGPTLAPALHSRRPELQIPHPHEDEARSSRSETRFNALLHFCQWHAGYLSGVQFLQTLLNLVIPLALHLVG